MENFSKKNVVSTAYSITQKTTELCSKAKKNWWRKKMDSNHITYINPKPKRFFKFRRCFCSTWNFLPDDLFPWWHDDISTGCEKNRTFKPRFSNRRGHCNQELQGLSQNIPGTIRKKRIEHPQQGKNPDRLTAHVFPQCQNDGPAKQGAVQPTSTSYILVMVKWRNLATSFKKNMSERLKSKNQQGFLLLISSSV